MVDGEGAERAGVEVAGGRDIDRADGRGDPQARAVSAQRRQTDNAGAPAASIPSMVGPEAAFGSASGTCDTPAVPFVLPATMGRFGMVSYA